ncbi:MAG: hypothetical protein SPLM_08810 [Spiroplasma phoeniceum]|uniref:hypothetical protein n=1 Tax=Spiroplasma phoeniceum TaxID=47835 RepID=UPI003276CEE3
MFLTKTRIFATVPSAEAFDENAIDAYAHIFWKNFSHYYNLFLHLDSNQLFIIILYIDGGEYIKDEKIARIIGTNNDLNMEQIEQDQLITNLINKNAQKYYKLNNDIVEKSTFSKLKIKINKITWSRIIIIFFSTKDKENFIEEIKNLFITFSSSYNDNNYKLNEEELRSFAYIIWNHFSYYYDLFWNLKIDESIRIISFTNIPKGYWYESNPNLYNHIVNKNNDIVDWETFNNRKIENKQESLYFIMMNLNIGKEQIINCKIIKAIYIMFLQMVIVYFDLL